MHKAVYALREEGEGTFAPPGAERSAAHRMSG